MARSDLSETVTVSSAAHPQQRGRERRLELYPVDSVQQLDELERFEEETRDRGLGALHHIRSRTRSRTHDIIISWEFDDPENPYNWPQYKKAFVVFVTGVLVVNSTMGSALPSLAIPSIAHEFGVTSSTQRVLPISVFLVGYVFGPIIWGPLSEHYGRRRPTIATFAAFTLFTMACALSPSWPALLIFRFFCGVFASSPIAIVAGILADVYADPRTRGKAFAVFMVTTVWGPLLSPFVSGLTSSTIGWRWAFWIGLAVAASSFVLVLFLPETFGPILLARRARLMRERETDTAAPRIVAPRDLEQTDLTCLLAVVLTRPLRMIFTEPIVSATCAYLALIYAIFYMSFQAFPIIFSGLYSLKPGLAGLCYLPIGAGAVLSMPVFWCWDALLARARESRARWVQREEYRRVPLACLGGPLFVVSLLWLGFTARADVHFVVPMLAGVPFGLGYVLVFMALLNYLTDAYEIFAASASAATSCCRSLLAVVLPLATTPMFARLGVTGACTLLGCFSAIMCVIPFIFIWKGPAMRSRSLFCIALRERREELQRKADEDRLRRERPDTGEKDQSSTT